MCVCIYNHMSTVFYYVYLYAFHVRHKDVQAFKTNVPAIYEHLKPNLFSLSVSVVFLKHTFLCKQFWEIFKIIKQNRGSNNVQPLVGSSLVFLDHHLVLLLKVIYLCFHGDDDV